MWTPNRAVGTAATKVSARMHEIADDLGRWVADGEQVALATVIYAHGPSPRPPGSQMAVSASGEMSGSVSGGCVEGAVVEEAQSILAGGPPKRLRRHD